MDQGGPGREKGTGAHCRELVFIRWDLVCRRDSLSAPARNISSVDQARESAWLRRIREIRGDTGKPQSQGRVEWTGQMNRSKSTGLALSVSGSGAEEQAASLPAR